MANLHVWVQNQQIDTWGGSAKWRPRNSSAHNPLENHNLSCVFMFVFQFVCVRRWRTGRGEKVTGCSLSLALFSLRVYLLGLAVVDQFLPVSSSHMNKGWVMGCNKVCVRLCVCSHLLCVGCLSIVQAVTAQPCLSCFVGRCHSSS